MGDTGEVNHRFNVPEQRAPFEGARQICDCNDLYRTGKNIRRLAHRRAHSVSSIGKFSDQGPSDEIRCAGYKDARHDLSQAKLQRSPHSIVATLGIAGKAKETGRAARESPLWNNLASFCQNGVALAPAAQKSWKTTPCKV